MTFAVIADLLAVFLAYETALSVRLSLGGRLFALLQPEELAHLTPPVWLVLGLWLVSAWWAKLYRPRTRLGPFDTIVQAVEAMGLATALTVVLSFLLYENSAGLSRAFLTLLFVFGVIAALALRAVLWLIVRAASSSDRPESVLVVGEGGDGTRKLVKRLLDAPDSHVAVRGVITVRDLRHAINRTRAERVLVVDDEVSIESLAECIDVCTAMNIPLNSTGGGITRFPTVLALGEVAGLRMLEVRRAEFERTGDLIKRGTDILIAGVALPVILPFLAALAVAIKVSSRGPVLFVSDRVGLGGRHFRFLKFRSMVPGADALRLVAQPQGKMDGHIFKAPNDSRITGVGRFMRRLSLDELPQLVNVLLGDMSLVGPRPLPASDLDPDGLSALHRTWSLERSTVRPGMTGLWQVRGRSHLSFEEMVRLDLLYIRTQSYRGDWKILVETIPAVLFGRGAM